MSHIALNNVDSTSGNPPDTPYNPPVPLFVLLIGIDTYPEVTKLKAAVADTRAVREYLQEHLLVPNSHITELYDTAATRVGIIKAFRKLRDDDRINKDDAILIFYAGHGCEMSPPEGWETNGEKIQGLVPYDYKVPTAKGGQTTALPDRTIAALIEDIAAKKGDNITVVLDCCHSASGTRVDTPTHRSRRLEDEDIVPLPHDIDKHIINRSGRSGRASQIPISFAYRGLQSHVLLAACGSKEEAKEQDDQGEFTRALLLTLRRLGTENLTYTQLMNGFPKLPQQNPQCEGKNVTRILFNNKLGGASPDMVRVEMQDGALKLQAGYAQGIAPGARFDIFRNHVIGPQSNPRLATLSVTTVQDFDSTLSSTDVLQGLRSPAYARLVGPGKKHAINVFVSLELEQDLANSPLWQNEFMSEDSEFPAQRTSDEKTADLCLDIGPNNSVTFETRNMLANHGGIARLPNNIPADAHRVLDVLRAAAQWNWHVSRENSKRPFGDLVRIEMFRAVEDSQEWDGDRRPMVRKGENLNKTGEVNIQVDPSHYYAYQIVNKSNFDLYPALFCFDASGLSITPYYLCSIPAGGTIDVPLLRNGSLPVGYGPGGTIPFQYSLPDNAELDVAVIKLFVATTPANFGLLEQASPFESARQDVRKVGLRPISEINRLRDSHELWDTQYIILRQHKSLPPPTEVELATPPETSFTTPDEMSTSQ